MVQSVQNVLLEEIEFSNKLHMIANYERGCIITHTLAQNPRLSTQRGALRCARFLLPQSAHEVPHFREVSIYAYA